MATLSRRSVLRSSLAVAAAVTLVRPYIANAAATTAEVWWPQSFIPEEDVSIKKIVADYEKASGNTIELGIMPFAPQRQKIVSAVTSGIVPDVIPANPGEIIAMYAWDDKLVDVTDGVETQKSKFVETALLNTYCYNNVGKKRSYYGVQFSNDVLPNHIWRPLVEKAGYTMEDLPRTWDAFYDFFKEVQKKLRAQGVLHLDDPKVKEAAIKAVTYPAAAFKEGFVPPSAINWNAAYDNNALHAKTIVMDLDGTISSEVAVIHKEQDYQDLVTIGLALSNDGKPVPSQAGGLAGLIPKGAKNVPVAKELLKFLIQPPVLNELLKVGLARRIPSMESIVKDDPWWLDPKDSHRVAYVQQGLLSPTVPQFWVFNPAHAQVQNEHVFPTAWAEIVKDGVTPQAAAEKAFNRIEEIFAKYPIASS
jgi:multiple sugar transport system substrate-binding protein